MSQVNSEFGEDPFATATVDGGFEQDAMMGEDSMMGQQEAPSVPQAPQYRKQEFSIYSVMLIMSFVFLTAAAIIFFIDAGKY